MNWSRQRRVGEEECYRQREQWVQRLWGITEQVPWRNCKFLQGWGCIKGGWKSGRQWIFGALGHLKGFGLHPTSNRRPGKVCLWACLPCQELIASLQRVDAKKLEGRFDAVVQAKNGIGLGGETAETEDGEK